MEKLGKVWDTSDFRVRYVKVCESVRPQYATLCEVFVLRRRRVYKM